MKPSYTHRYNNNHKTKKKDKKKRKEEERDDSSMAGIDGRDPSSAIFAAIKRFLGFLFVLIFLQLEGSIPLIEIAAHGVVQLAVCEFRTVQRMHKPSVV